jgi:hypothetical protein
MRHASSLTVLASHGAASIEMTEGVQTTKEFILIEASLLIVLVPCVWKGNSARALLGFLIFVFLAIGDSEI